MTNCKNECAPSARQKTKKLPLTKLGMRESFLSLIAIFFMLLILKNSSVAIDYMTAGLKLCTGTVIPSLFPFMVISDVLVNLNIASVLEKYTPRPLGRLLGISPKELGVFLLGTICGFPVGAKVAGAMYARGELEADELERLLTYSNNPSSAFLISAVGASLYGDEKIGLIIYASLLASSFISMQLWRIVPKRKNRRQKSCERSVQMPTPKVDLTGAISRSIGAVMNVCAYVMFFSTVCGILRVTFFSSLHSNLLSALIGGFFEMSTGISQASAIQEMPLCVCVSAMIGAWSGLSVHLQIISTLELEAKGRQRISLKPYFLHKALACATSGAVCYLLCLLLL